MKIGIYFRISVPNLLQFHHELQTMLLGIWVIMRWNHKAQLFCKHEHKNISAFIDVNNYYCISFVKIDSLLALASRSHSYDCVSLGKIDSLLACLGEADYDKLTTCTENSTLITCHKRHFFAWKRKFFSSRSKDSYSKKSGKKQLSRLRSSAML